jgi:hypothetical protein
MIPPSLEIRYNRLIQTPSSINEHLDLLYQLASECGAVAEFGVDIGQSTTAFLMAQPSLLLSYDPVRKPELNELLTGCEYRYEIGGAGPKGFRTQIGRTRWDFTLADSKTILLPEVDLLLIDSSHHYDQAKAELDLHHSRVRQWILLHDIVAYGEVGEAGLGGIIPAINWFLESHPEWAIQDWLLHNNGMAVLKRRSG